MNRKYISIKYTREKWEVINKLAKILSDKRGVKVSLPDASTEAARRMIDELNIGKVNEVIDKVEKEGGGTVYLSDFTDGDGTLTVPKPIVIGDNVTLRGDAYDQNKG